MSVWIAIVAAGIGSYLLRMLPVALLGLFRTPAWLDRAGLLVAPVAFAALAATAVAGGTGTGAGVLAKLVAVTVAAGSRSPHPVDGGDPRGRDGRPVDRLGGAPGLASARSNGGGSWMSRRSDWSWS